MANNVDVKDAGANTRTMKTTDNAGVHTPSVNVDNLPASWDGTKTNAAAALGAGGAGMIGWLSTISTTLSGTLAISAGSLPLPTGAAKEAKQDTANTSLANIDTKLGGTLTISGTVNIAAAQTVGLVAGAATIGKVDINAGANTIGKVDLNAGENRLGVVGSGMFTGQNFLSRPADTTAYAVGDLVGASTAVSSTNVIDIATMARAALGPVAIRRVRLRKSSNTLTNAQFRVHLFRTVPTLTVGDNAAFNTNGVLATDKAIDYLGAFDVTMQQGFSDGAMGFGIPIVGGEIMFNPSDQHLYAVIEARAIYTPANSEAFTVILESFRD